MGVLFVGISLLNIACVMCNFVSDKGHGGVRVVPLPRDILSKVREKTDVFGLARASVLLLFNILNY